MSSGRKKYRKISEEELERIKIYWLAGHTETYIANVFDRHRWTIRKLMMAAGLPCTTIIQHRHAKEYVKARIGLQPGE